MPWRQRPLYNTDTESYLEELISSCHTVLNRPEYRQATLEYYQAALQNFEALLVQLRQRNAQASQPQESPSRPSRPPPQVHTPRTPASLPVPSGIVGVRATASPTTRKTTTPKPNTFKSFIRSVENTG